MTNEQFYAGATVYNQHGEQAELVAKSQGEYLVRPILEDDDGHTYTGDIETWTRVFRKPPKPKLDAETAAAERELAQLREEVKKLRDERYQFDTEERARKERITAHEQLADLDRYLAGEITHYVAKHSYSDIVSIIPVGETVEEYNSSNNFGLLELYPSRSWDKRIVWRMRYRVRGDWRSEKEFTVIPCCGEEQAKAVAAEVLQRACANQLTLDIGRRHYTKELIECCKQFGVDVPQQLIDDMYASYRASFERQLADHLERAEKIRADLATLTPEAA